MRKRRPEMIQTNWWRRKMKTSNMNSSTMILLNSLESTKSSKEMSLKNDTTGKIEDSSVNVVKITSSFCGL